MPNYEYKVVPAPSKGTKAKGLKTAQDRFALSIETVLNQMGALGWEYLRAELLPSDERSGLTGTSTNWRNVLVFRRPVGDRDDVTPPLLAAPIDAAPDSGAPEQDTQPRPDDGAAQPSKDNSIEEVSDDFATAEHTTQAAENSKKD